MSSAKVDATADVIRRVALEMFAARGYASTSVRDITHAAGIRGASMYNHFASKESILWDLTQAALTQLFDAWSHADAKLTNPSPADRLAAFVRADVRYHAEHCMEAALINAQLISLESAHRQEAIQRRADYEGVLRSLLEDCLVAGPHDVPDLRLTTYAVLQMSAAVATWFRPEGDLTVDEVCDTYAVLALKMVALQG
jgi:AcrR family transcriptional regulator